ncbi:MAG: SIS domain-containing protein [Bacteroidia bacterium]
MAITHEQSLEQFYQQFDYVLTHYKNHGKSIQSYDNVVIGGLGGSGIGGRIVRLNFWKSSPVPVEVYSDYSMPGYAGKKTLAILCSYSGMTEETLSMFQDAQSRGCDIMIMAAGGKIEELAHAHGYPFFRIDIGYQPRMTLGFAVANLTLMMGELLGDDQRSAIEALRAQFSQPEAMVAQAKHMHTYFADTIRHKFVVVCDAAYEAVAIRFCQQIQENGKGEGFVSVLPEANHNMIESYYEKHDTNFIFLNSHENPRVSARFGFLKGVLTDLGNKVYEYPVNDASLASQFEVIHATDWLSIWASNDKGADNMQVGIIMKLKGYLSNLS